MQLFKKYFLKPESEKKIKQTLIKLFNARISLLQIFYFKT